jgi:hypothetical protein
LFYTNVTILSEKPTALHRNERGQLHNFNAAAIEWKDGYRLYRFNGVRQITEAHANAKTFTKEEILNEKNADVRRELIRKIGMNEAIKILQPKVIDEKYGYKLVNMDLGEKRDRPYLIMKNPSIGTDHIEGCSPEVKTVEQAICYRNSLKEFSLPKELT